MASGFQIADEATARMLSEFEICLYRWNLATDALVWGGGADGFLRATGLAGLRTGQAFADLREDGGERTAWALSARSGDTARFVFAVPAGPASVIWVEDQARRTEEAGAPVVTGVLRRTAAPRLPLGDHRREPSEREARAALLDRLGRAGIGQDRSYVLYGIDTLRDLHRALGPDIADEVVAEVDRRLAAARPPGSLHARVGAALFGLAEVGSDARALTLAIRRQMDAVGRHAIETALGPVTVTVSAGVAHAPRGTRLPAEPYANALAAHDEARLGRVEGLRFARTGAGASHLRERYVTAARLVMEAIAENRLTVAFQPVVRADATETVAFHECLARILDRDGAVIPAGSFMPAIEHLGLVRQVDRAVLRRVIETLHANPGLRLSVNLSPQSMQDGEWLSTIEAGLAGMPDAADRLILEVTEASAMLDPARTLGFMNHVRGTGCAFALDDFGAGYTSFRHFRDFRFDAVKIDGSFIGGIARSPDQQLLVRTLVSIADHFNMFTVAEFVETEPDAAFLRDLGIDCLQGYRYGAPELRPAWAEAAAPARRLRA